MPVSRYPALIGFPHLMPQQENTQEAWYLQLQPEDAAQKLKHSSLQCGKDNEETKEQEEEPTIELQCGPGPPTQHTFRGHHSQDIPIFHVNSAPKVMQKPLPFSLLTSLLPSLLSIDYQNQDTDIFKPVGTYPKGKNKDCVLSYKKIKN